MKYDVIIIGSGLGGLQCGYLLAKRGLHVCVVEKQPRVGGCMQHVVRGHSWFDTGFHYVGGLDEGQPLHRIFKCLDLLDLPWYCMDREAFDEVVIHGASYYFANGYDRFADTLARQFPGEAESLRQYAAFLEEVGDTILHIFNPQETGGFSNQALFARSAYDYVCQTVANPRLRQVLSGTSLKMELDPHTLPLYVFAQINSSYIQSAWRLRGPGQQIADRLAGGITAMGGTVLTQAEAVRFLEKQEALTAVKTSDGQTLYADYFISDIHPAAALPLLEGSALVRRVYRTRIMQLPNTFGMFTVHCVLKEQTVPYFNRNIFLYETEQLWSPLTRGKALMVSCQVPEDGSLYTATIDLLMPMDWGEVAPWQDTRVGQRGAAYEEFKNRKAAQCLYMLQQYAPQWRAAVERVYTSTPLTYRDYTATVQGSAYGIRKDCHNLMTTLLTPKTPIKNLLFTGQNLNLHGVLGVSITSLLTCAQLGVRVDV